jgi:hypothetical protein
MQHLSTATHTLDGRATDDRAELIDGARSDLGSLRNASISAALLLSGLDESLTSGHRRHNSQ